uniref:Uncharacterized protein n=1 Tax=Fagus sylvatica TaxID=28930 RepID=A0A2N9ILY1_FAGSY
MSVSMLLRIYPPPLPPCACIFELNLYQDGKDIDFSALLSPTGEKAVNYPTRPVDRTTDFEGTTSLQPSQPVSSGNAVSGSIPGAHGGAMRSVPRQMVGSMQRMQPQAMQAYNLTSQAGIGGGINPGGIPMQRGVPQQQQLRRKDPGMGLTGYPPQQKSRR